MRIGSKLVTVPLSGRALVSLTGDGGTILALDAAGRLAALGLEGRPEGSPEGSPEGRSLWTAETGIEGGALILSPGRIVVTGRGRAVSLSRRGEVYREASITNAVSPGLLSPSGLLFSAGADWILTAYRFEAPLGTLGPPRLPPYPLDAGAVEALHLYDLQIAGGDRQLVLIADIEKNLESARLGGREAADRAILGAIAKGEFSSDYAPARRRFLVSAMAEAEACRVLGMIGSPDSIGLLAEVAGGAADPAVRASAIAALGNIGVDPDGRSGTAFARALRGIGGDEEVALTLIGAIESMARKSGVPPSVEAARALMELAQPPFGQSIRDRAIAALGRVARGF